jgi:hypothetical protein
MLDSGGRSAGIHALLNPLNAHRDLEITAIGSEAPPPPAQKFIYSGERTDHDKKNG